MFTYDLCQIPEGYAVSSARLTDAAKYNTATLCTPGLSLELLACDHRGPSDFPLEQLYADCSDGRGQSSDSNLRLFQLNSVSAMSGLLSGWRCSGLKLHPQQGLQFFFVFDSDRPTPLFPDARGCIQLRPESFDHVRFLVSCPELWPSAPPLSDLIPDFNSQVKLNSLRIGKLYHSRQLVIDYWTPQLSEIFAATMEARDRPLWGRVIELAGDGYPRRMLEFLRGADGVCSERVRITEF